MFKFGIMGAGQIAPRLVRALKNVNDAEVVAVSSKSMERAEKFASENGVSKAYDSYEEMLIKEDLDAVYIATTPESHYELSMLCLKHKVPVLCEKAMFMNGRDAKEACALSEKLNVYLMEGLWSRYLPTLKKAKEWLENGEIGELKSTYASVGMVFDKEKNARNFDPVHGGGAAFDLTCYAYEITDLFVGKETEIISIDATFDENGIDLKEDVRYKNASGVQSRLYTTLIEPIDETLELVGTKGSIIVPNPHWGRNVYLYDANGNEVERFEDTETLDGFEYEIEDLIASIREGKCESSVVPHELTVRCALLFDLIYQTK